MASGNGYNNNDDKDEKHIKRKILGHEYDHIFYIYDEYFFKVTRNLRRRCNSAFIYVEK